MNRLRTLSSILPPSLVMHGATAAKVASMSVRACPALFLAEARASILSWAIL